MNTNITNYINDISKDHEKYKYTDLVKFFNQIDFKDTADSNQVMANTNDFDHLTVDGQNITGSIANLEIIKDNAKIILNFKANTKFEKPVLLTYIANNSDYTQTDVSIQVGKFTELVLIENIIEKENSAALVLKTIVHQEVGSQFEHIQLSNLRDGSVKLAEVDAEVAKDATYRNIAFNINGKLNRNNSITKVNGTGGHAESYLLYLLDKTDQSDFNTVIHHHIADTTSNQIAKGILGGESKGIFTGRIHIHPDAQRVASGQLNKNLLLTPKAQSFSQPQLEIFADDVKCSHGSTTGQLSNDEIFYFESRGIPADKARTLLALGFGLEIVLKIQNTKARSFIEANVRKALAQKFKLGADL